MNQTPTISSQDVLVRWQPTPNPAALKFVVNQALKKEGKATYSAAVECAHVPLGQSLFQISGVKQIHFFNNTLTVTHDGSLSEEELTAQVTSVLKTRVPVHDADFVADPSATPPAAARARAEGLSEERQKIEEILDRTIRPGLQADGGDIEVLSFENNELRILYQGACGGCPSSMMGTLDAIQGILQQELGNEQLIVVPA